MKRAPKRARVDFRTERQTHGRILRGNLLACGHDEAWLFSLLQAHGLEKPEQVFLLIADNKGGVILLPKQGKGEKQC